VLVADDLGNEGQLLEYTGAHWDAVPFGNERSLPTEGTNVPASVFPEDAIVPEMRNSALYGPIPAFRAGSRRLALKIRQIEACAG
jgi:hypothetical protein